MTLSKDAKNILLSLMEEKPKDAKKSGIFDLLVEFESLTKTFERLLYPTLLTEADDAIDSDDFFEQDLKAFKVHFLNICNMLVKLSKELNLIETGQKDMLKEQKFSKRLDNEVKDFLSFYGEQVCELKDKAYVKKMQSLYFAYIQLATVINSLLDNYNKAFKKDLKVLGNLPEDFVLDINIKNTKQLKVYFEDWLRDINKVI